MIRMEPVGVLVICLRVKLYSPDSKALLVTTRNINVKVKTFSLRILIFTAQVLEDASTKNGYLVLHS